MRLYLGYVNRPLCPRFVWDDDRWITNNDRIQLRRIYRDLRSHGLTPTIARWHMWDLVDLGTRAERDSPKASK
jgi:hypothetical protein